MKDVTLIWLNRFEYWLNTNKTLKDTTKSSIFRNLRAAYNKAVYFGYISGEKPPFEKFKMSKFDLSTKKRAIEKEEMIKIMNVELDVNNRNLILAKDLFIFSYLCGGINFIDIAYLTIENIEERKLNYKRKKTGVNIPIPLSEKVIQILNRHNYGSGKKGYIFPIFDAQAHKTPQQRENRRLKVEKEVNKKIKELSKIAGVDNYQNITFYAARHTFATVCRKSGENRAMISESMGHKNGTTTDIYFKSFDTDEKTGMFNNLV